ncbi:MAG: hypothetical protein JXB13_20625 [Phycisphaerae bacterium]|nr:hypothetical protein [Phycisphaerae bacterium]
MFAVRPRPGLAGAEQHPTISRQGFAKTSLGLLRKWFQQGDFNLKIP